ncbi:hypothetical protein BDN71DRAFT_1432417 [Pleurotus eryngii]|uniref:Uncharacterized protein n=1 Tax=Pleurotus eryngii TaxID=5323 RepID=A0A9P5ZT80_PLEER|nr:hypothetical protein BDN71DRAFT_1432417 [Pleurotus eryngii]
MTIGRTWHQRNNLAALFLKSDEASSAPIQYCAPMFEALVTPITRGGLAFDAGKSESDNPHILTPKAKNLPAELTALFPSQSGARKADFLTTLTIDGLRYTTASKHHGNSLVLVESHDGEFRAKVEYILKFDKQGPGDAWFVVRRFRKASIPKDPFDDWPDLGAQLLELTSQGRLELTHSSSIQSHLAMCTILWADRQVMVAISLSKHHILPNDDSDNTSNEEDMNVANMDLD